MVDINNYQGKHQGLYNYPDYKQESSNKTWLFILIPILIVLIGLVIFLFMAFFSKTISEDEFSDGVSIKLKEDKGVKFIFGEEEHTIKVDSVKENLVSLIIYSNEIKTDINIGEEKKFDLDDDDFYDIKIKLKDIKEGVPELYIKKIHEAICTEDWDCGDWSSCTEEGKQTRTCTDLNDCGTIEDKPSLTKTCTYVEPCVESWNCTNWSSCVDGNKTRTCTDLNDCGTIEDKPGEISNCSINILLCDLDVARLRAEEVINTDPNWTDFSDVTFKDSYRKASPYSNFCSVIFCAKKDGTDFALGFTLFLNNESIYKIAMSVQTPDPDCLEKPLTSELCHSDDYSLTTTKHFVSGGYEFLIELDDSSQDKLEDAIESKGDVALEEITDLTCLEFLDLAGTDVMDIAPLENLVNLRKLYLSNTNVKDVAPLENLVNLETLNLAFTEVSNEDCQHLIDVFPITTTVFC